MADLTDVRPVHGNYGASPGDPRGLGKFATWEATVALQSLPSARRMGSPSHPDVLRNTVLYPIWDGLGIAGSGGVSACPGLDRAVEHGIG